MVLARYRSVRSSVTPPFNGTLPHTGSTSTSGRAAAGRHCIQLWMLHRVPALWGPCGGPVGVLWGSRGGPDQRGQGNTDGPQSCSLRGSVPGPGRYTNTARASSAELSSVERSLGSVEREYF